MRRQARCQGGQEQQQQQFHRCLYVLVTAHPDDESMFFVPTLYGLARQCQIKKANQGEKEEAADEIWLLCLTTGNYDGLGTVRIQELENVCRTVLPQIDKLIVLDYDDSNNVCRCQKSQQQQQQQQQGLPRDGPREAWNVEMTAKCIHETLLKALKEKEKEEEEAGAATACTARKERGKTTTFHQLHFITFDEGGVSGHVNHRDTFRAVQQFLTINNKKITSRHSQEPFSGKSDRTVLLLLLLSQADAFVLQTEHNWISKYIPMYSWWLQLGAWLACLLVWFLGRYWREEEEVWRSSRTIYYEYHHHHHLHRNCAVKNNHANNTITVYRLHRPVLNWRAMSTHDSQFVWYRRLFVVFSCYTYVNVLRPLDLATMNAGNDGGGAMRSAAAPKKKGK